MLHIHLCNRSDSLATTLATQMRADPLPLLETEQVIVSSTAVARWLSLRLADALGIATQTAYPFPAAYVWQLFGRVLPDVATTNPFDRTVMQWRLLRLLGASRSAEIRQYLVGDDGVRQYEFAGKLAALFERYLVERPDWIAAWNAGKRRGLGPDEAWQAGLWQALMSELSAMATVAPDHPRERFFMRLKENERARERLPRRITLFAVEAMPALYWDVFVGLAEWIEINVFVLVPSREYWGDIDRLRERLRISIDHPEAAVLYETGHPLLASLGRARQHAVVRLAEAAERVASEEHASFVEPPATLLGTLQRDILELVQGTEVSNDATLQIHACHGAQREAEVLLDRLLDLFEKLPDLKPADILILAPDIETYAPIVAAVLTHAVPAHRIPCAVADRPLATAPTWCALHRVCSVAAGDLDAESVMSLLDEPALRRALAIGENDLPRLRDWVKESGIRWGVDGTMHSWRAGLRRLLLGVALPDAPERLWNEQLPVTGIEGERAELLGRFADFAEALFDLNAKLGARETVPEWSRILAAALERFLVPTEAEESQAQRLREMLGRMGELACAVECATRLPLSVMLRELDAQLAELAPAQAFASGAATIAALQPGRPLPARVVCLVGMNDGAWPRPATPLGFDLVASHPRPGDRNRRGEERHAFLETLLCATDALVVTYTGRDPRSNLEQPPAAPLAELLDTLAAMTGTAAGELVVQHPLQPFGAAYFAAGNAELFSFDAEHCATGSTKTAPPFIPPTTLLERQENATVELDELKRFFSNPVRYFMRESLGVHLEESEELLEIVESFVPDRLEAYRLREAHFAGLAAGVPSEETTRLLRARAWLPQEVAGDLADRSAHDEAAPLWQTVRPWAEAERLPPCETIFEAGGVNLNGRLDGLSEHGLWRVRHGRLRPQDRLRLWLDHLLLNIASPAGVARQSVLFARDGTLCLSPEPRAAEYLTGLLAIYREGLQSPLPFYPETAWAWLEQKNWRRVWEGDAFNQKPGERDDPYVRLVLRDRVEEPLGEEFRTLAARILGPLHDALKVGDG